MKKLSLMGLLMGIMCFFGIGGVSAETTGTIPDNDASGETVSGEVIKLNDYFKDENLKKFTFESFKKENPKTTKTKVEELTDEELASIKKFEMTTNGLYEAASEAIKDLSGFEKLTGLENVILMTRGIEVDFSNQKNLQDLAVYSDSKIKNISTKVVSLYVHGDLSNVENLSELVNLEKLNSSNGKLDVLDLSKFSKLKSLELFHVSVSALDLSKNKNLTQLSFAGVSKCKNLDLSRNQLESVEIAYSDFENIKFGNQKKLTNLKISDAKFTYLDLTGCSVLKEVNIDNSVKCVDVVKEIKNDNENGAMLVVNKNGNTCSAVMAKTDKKETIKNPKTGFGLPVALGLGALTITLGTSLVIRKKNLFKNI